MNSFQQGVASAKAGNLVLARMHLQQAAAAEPDNPHLWLWLAWVAESPAAAIDACEWIVARDPEHIPARAALLWLRTLAEFDVDDTSLPDVTRERAALQDLLTPAVETVAEVEAPEAELDAAADEPVEEETSEVDEPADDLSTLPFVAAVEAEVAEIDDPSELSESTTDEFADAVPEPQDHTVADDEPEERIIQEIEVRERARPAQTHGWFDRTLEGAPPVDSPESLARVGAAPPEEMTEKPVETDSVPEPEEDTRPLVMIVDDSATVRRLVSMTLEAQDYRVVTAADGVEAIDALEGVQPRLILMDINMPRLDGYRLCKFVRKHERTRDIPVVMLSGKDGTFDRLRGRLVGCSEYITKPFDPDELNATVARHLQETP